MLSAKRVLLAECDVCVTALTAAQQTAVTVQASSDHTLLEHEFLSSAHMHDVLSAGPSKAAAFQAAGLALVRLLSFGVVTCLPSPARSLHFLSSLRYFAPRLLSCAAQ
jgi:hypothetical protein